MGRRKEAFSLYLRRIRLPGKRTAVKVYYYRTYYDSGMRTAGRSTGKETVPAAEEYGRTLQARDELLSGPRPRPRSEIGGRGGSGICPTAIRPQISPMP